MIVNCIMCGAEVAARRVTKRFCGRNCMAQHYTFMLDKAGRAKKNLYNLNRYYEKYSEIRAQQNAVYAALTPAQKRERGRLGKLRGYGISQADYEALAASQGNCCAICRKPAAENKHGVLFIDHCHATGEVRGLLCDPCNRMIGCARDNAQVLELGAQYLRIAQ